MDKITEVVINYINMRSTGALLITGDWGSGKTFHLRNKVFKKIEEETGRVPIIVSLFGEAEKHTIGQKVMFAYLDKKGRGARLSTASVAKSLKHIADSFPKIKDYVDFEKLTIGTGENLFRILPHEQLVLVFDDMERMSDNLPIDEFLGIINDLVENNGCKVVLVANEAEIKEGISFKEKTIEKTFHFIPDIDEVFNSIINSYKKSFFKDFAMEHKEFFLKSIDIRFVSNKEIRRSYTNIRTLKFAVEHFKYVFELFPQKDGNFSDPLIVTQLKNLWYFTIAVSIEFRKPSNLTYSERKDLNSTPPTFFDLESLIVDDAMLIDVLHETPTSTDSGYADKFRKIYYERFKEPYIYHEHVYDLITGGDKVEKKIFRESLERSYHVKDGDVPPGHKILNKIQHEGYWSYTNEEIVTALNALLDFCRKGELNDLSSYINASVFLFGLRDLTQKTEQEVLDNLLEGVGLFLNAEKLSGNLLDQREIIGNNYLNDESIKKIIQLVDARIEELKETAGEEELKRIQALFKEDIVGFVKEFSPERTMAISSDKPILNNLDSDEVCAAVKDWTPNEIMHIHSLLRKRYVNFLSSFNPFREELSFLQSIQRGIDELDLTAPLLTIKTINTKLTPILTQSIEILSRRTDEEIFQDIIMPE